VKVPPGNWFAPPGSNRGSSGGNEAAEALGEEGRSGDLASVQAVIQVNAVQAPKRVMQEPTRREPWEGRSWWKVRAKESIKPAGVLATACKQMESNATREAPTVMQEGQLATRERKAGPYGVTERSVVPRKPGNAGGGKGPWLKGDARSDKGQRDWR
jgi:hypothetical protein